jgi:hypothetical protein
MSYEPEQPEPEPPSQTWHEPAMQRFFSDDELAAMWYECQRENSRQVKL